MEDFVSFCQDNFIRPVNILDLLDSMIDSPDIRIWAYQVYHRILTAVMKELNKRYDDFEVLLKNPHKMNPKKKERELEKEVEYERSRIRNVLKEMEDEKYSSRTQKMRKNIANFNKDVQEKFMGIRVPDPTRALPLYFESQRCKDMDQALVSAAETGKALTASELSRFTNHLLVRISLKNGLRKQVTSPK